MKRAVSGTMLTLLLTGILTLAFNVQPVKAEPTTWCVDDDGPADFSRIQDAINIANPRDTIFVHNGTYYENLVVTKNNLTIVGESRVSTIIDGGASGSVVQVEANHVILSGFTVQRGYEGVSVHYAEGTTIADNIITNNQYRGVFLADSCDNVIIENDIMNTYEGIHVRGEGSNNVLKYNLVADEYYGITFLECHEELHIVSSNTLVDNTYNIYLPDSSGIKFYHNNFFKKYRQVYGGYLNTWDDGYPSGGNYWSDYAGVDANFDGIGDSPYVIDESNQDKYPLMSPWIERTVGVKVGDWAKYSVDTSWTGVLDPHLEMLSETEWGMIEVTNIQSTIVTFTGTSHFKNGSELTAPGVEWDIAPTGSFGFIFWFTGSNLQAGERVYPSGSMIINEIVTQTYCGAPRENNHLNWSTSGSIVPGPPYDLNELDCYWDHATGILTEELLEGSTEDLSSTLSIHLKMVDTNLWEAPIPTTVNDLKTKTEELGSEGDIDNQGIVKSLLAKLNLAQKLVDKGKINEAKSVLEDDFIPQVQNLAGIHITPEAADILIKSAEYIVAHL